MTDPVRRSLLFLLVCSPAYVAPGLVRVSHPIVLVVILLAVTYLFLRFEGRSLGVLGIEWSWRRLRELATGYLAGALFIGCVAVCIGLVLPFPWTRNPLFNPGIAAFSALWLLCGNTVEELLFRGYSFERLIAGVGHWRAQLVTALVFAVFHVLQGWSWQAAFFGTTIGSLLFGLVFVRWQSLPAAAGVHAATNWTRDLLLLDPPGTITLFAPLAPRSWTAGERLAAGLVFNGAVLIVCALLWRSIERRRASVV